MSEPNADALVFLGFEAKGVVRGQFRGYRSEPGVAPDSSGETFAALRLEIDSWRWAGVPFYSEPGTWGPKEVEQQVAPPGGWRNPLVGVAGEPRSTP